MYGGMTDNEQQDVVERFGRKEDPMRVLLCSDVASEGLNLHYFCHRLIHFDLPWSLMVFQQRNGRVDQMCIRDSLGGVRLPGSAADPRGPDKKAQ